jgi:broad specificity phosphatase PhoE
MNRLFLMRHGGSTGNEDPSFYSLNDSAICLTTNGIRQCLATSTVLSGVTPRWNKPGDFAVEAYVSEYTRAQQTARIVLDQMNLLSLKPRIQPLLNERNYGTKYEDKMDQDPNFAGNDSESGAKARLRVVGLLHEIDSVLYRADVLAFSHFGTIRALVANVLQLSDTDMMKFDVPNGAAFLFERSFDDTGKPRFSRKELKPHILEKSASYIKLPDMVRA